jgi:polyphosphate kinase
MSHKMDAVDLRNPDLYINRELSQLEFNWRVLAQAKDEQTPLLERLRFLCISSTNMDEFFEIRVAGIMQTLDLAPVQPGPDGKLPGEILKAISARAHELVSEQYRVLNDLLIPQLAQSGIRFIRRNELGEAQEKWVRGYFEKEVLPMLSPLGIDPAHPFPRILNKSLNFIITLKGKDAFGRSSNLAVVQAPRALPRIIPLPPQESSSGPHDFVFLSSVMHHYMADLFPGMKVTGSYQFRVTRNSDLFVDTEEVQDLLRAVQGELQERRFGDTVRLEVVDDCPDDVIKYLLSQLELGMDDVYKVNGPVNLNRLTGIYDMVERNDLKYVPFTPTVPAALSKSSDLFETLRKHDVLLHHPFESFAPVIEFLRQAANDTHVLAVKQTLYRTAPDSAIVDHLVSAARAGKEVTVVIELRARFDEAANIALANRLQEAGAHVVYGVVGYKTHAKMILVVRREGKQLCHYVHLGTGNYHPRTARVYTDYGLLTSNKEIGDDVHKVFLQLTSLGRVAKLQKLLQSPFTLHDGLIDKIRRETKHAEQGKPARIIAKMNSLVEAQVIQALYAASVAGVTIDLIVRGTCSLRPGIPGVSDRISVVSIVGRFLEHTRACYFHNAGEPEVYCASADWMDRNFFRRVEVGFPVEVKALKERITRDLELYLQDNTQAWSLRSDGIYERKVPAADAPLVSAQITLQRELAGG